MKSVVKLIIVLGLMTACSSKTTSPEEGHNSAKIMASVSSSLIRATIVKDDTIPVKGTFFIKEATLDLTPQKERAEVIVDVSTWDSGLSMRDNRVTSVFFEVAKPENATAKLTFDQLSSDVVSALKEKNGHVMVKGNFEFGGVTLPVEAELHISQKGEALSVITASPLVLSIQALKKQSQLDALIQLCGHKNIKDTVEVEAALVF